IALARVRWLHLSRQQDYAAHYGLYGIKATDTNSFHHRSSPKKSSRQHCGETGPVQNLRFLAFLRHAQEALQTLSPRLIEVSSRRPTMRRSISSKLLKM